MTSEPVLHYGNAGASSDSFFLINGSAPHGITMLITLVVFLGSINLLAISIVGAYVGTILEETKRRPRFLRDSLIRFGESVPSTSDGHDLGVVPRAIGAARSAGATG